MNQKIIKTKKNMIDSITIRNSSRTPFPYCVDIPALAEGTQICFKPGINIIVGSNGCGKSTLLNTIATYLLCEKSIKTPTGRNTIGESLKSLHLWNDMRAGKEAFLDGVDVRHDYRGVLFQLRNGYEMDDYESMANFNCFQSAFAKKRLSMGQNTKFSLNQLFKAMFAKEGNEYLTFPLKELKELSNSINDVWKARIKQLLKYYERNQIQDVTEENFSYTVLMDEPDRNLDIDNIDEVVSVLSTPKEMTQIIAAVHNPLVIGQLSKKNYINFIEMTPDYVSKVHDAIRKCRTLNNSK